MRIIAGQAKGRKLKSVNTAQVRPTTDRVKEAVFNILGAAVNGTIVLDLYSGFGGLGLEALSRQAARAVFIEKHYKNAAIIKENIALCGFEEQARVMITDVFNYLQEPQHKFDIIFMDPPYGRKLVNKTIRAIISAQLLTTTGLIIIESEQNTEINKYQELKIIKDKNYGDTKISIYQLKDDNNGN